MSLPGSFRFQSVGPHLRSGHQVKTGFATSGMNVQYRTRNLQGRSLRPYLVIGYSLFDILRFYARIGFVASSDFPNTSIIFNRNTRRIAS
jgi:hypothetical protein